MKPSVLQEKICCEGGKGEKGDQLLLFVRVQVAGRKVSSSNLCFPSRALEQDEVIKAGCQYIITISLLCKLHAQMLLFSASGFTDLHSQHLH